MSEQSLCWATLARASLVSTHREGLWCECPYAAASLLCLCTVSTLVGMGQARLGGDEIGANPTDRGKNGSKKSILTDRQGGPLSVVLAGANVHDAKLLDKTIEAMIVDRPKPTKAKPQNLCLDKGYDNPTGKAAVEKHNYTGHIRRIGEEKLSKGKKSILLVGGLWKEL